MPKRKNKKVASKRVARTATTGKKKSINTLVSSWSVMVETITFSGIIGIYYARIGPHNIGYQSYLVAPNADYTSTAGTFHHFSPEELRPAAGTPHWQRKAATNKREFSWPAAYARTGATGGQSWKLKAKFSMEPKVTNVRKVKIKATAKTGGLAVTEKEVEFTNGVSQECEFDLTGVPATVQHLNGIEFCWVAEFFSESQPCTVTKHTLFILDEVPKAGTNTGSVNGNILWDVYVWSCQWAQGTTGFQNVLDAIWGHFDPVQAGGHDTGLVYWKNQHIGIKPKQEMLGAVQSQDDLNPLQQNAVSCKVFDFMLINCLAVQGISSAEIKLKVTPMWPPLTFTYLGKTYKITGWYDTVTTGPGNTNAPAIWESHWIANVWNAGQWNLYDPSYGEGPVKSRNPTAPSSGLLTDPKELDVFEFEPCTLRKFYCTDCTDPMAPFQTSLARSSVRGKGPHLLGYYIWINP